MTDKKLLIIRIVQIVVFSLLLCFLMCAYLTWYLSSVPETIASLEEEGRMDNTIWLIKYTSVILPVVTLAVLLTLLYSGQRRYLPVKTQTDKAIVVGIVFAFTYLVLFALIYVRSPLWYLPEAEGEEEVKSLFERSFLWFCVQLIPFVIALSYHITKASNEKKELSAEQDEEVEIEEENENEE